MLSQPLNPFSPFTSITGNLLYLKFSKILVFIFYQEEIVDFFLSEEQKMVVDMAKKFSETEIRPIAAKIDQTHEYPADTIR